MGAQPVVKPIAVAVASRQLLGALDGLFRRRQAAIARHAMRAGGVEADLAFDGWRLIFALLQRLHIREQVRVVRDERRDATGEALGEVGRSSSWRFSP